MRSLAWILPRNSMENFGLLMMSFGHRVPIESDWKSAALKDFKFEWNIVSSTLDLVMSAMTYKNHYEQIKCKMSVQNMILFHHWQLKWYTQTSLCWSYPKRFRLHNRNDVSRISMKSNLYLLHELLPTAFLVLITLMWLNWIVELSRPC